MFVQICMYMNYYVHARKDGYVSEFTCMCECSMHIYIYIYIYIYICAYTSAGAFECVANLSQLI